MIAQFTQRTKSDIKETDVFCLGKTRTAFNNIRGHGNSSPSHLRGQTIHLFPGERSCELISCQCNIVRKLKSFELGMVAHGLFSRRLKAKGYRLKKEDELGNWSYLSFSLQPSSLTLSVSVRLDPALPGAFASGFEQSFPHPVRFPNRPWWTGRRS